MSVVSPFPTALKAPPKQDRVRVTPDSKTPDEFIWAGRVVFTYRSKYQVKHHAFKVHAVTCAGQAEPWRFNEYQHARDLAELLLDGYFTAMRPDDIEPITWGAIADDIRSLGTLSENPL